MYCTYCLHAHTCTYHKHAQSYHVYVCMYVWMDEWMDGWMDGCVKYNCSCTYNVTGVPGDNGYLQ